MTIKDICYKFNVDAISVKEHGQGLINGSYVVVDKNNKRYLLQEINSHVFKDVGAVMFNIEKTTEHISKKALEQGDRKKHRTLTLLPTINGENYVAFFDDKNRAHYFRMFDFIEGASSYDVASEDIIYECGVGYGKFQKDLADFPADKLYETIPDFHNTHARYMNFMNVIYNLRKEGQHLKITEAFPEIKTAGEYGLKYADIIVSALDSGQIPLRVVHNDTKLNNIMIDDQTHKAVCAIDLDTVMPGSMLFDYGDAIRSCANTGAEDNRDLDDIGVDIPKFKAFTTGYLSEIADCVTEEELKLMPIAPAVISYELGLRFLTDYLEGNKYFKCDPTRPQHNLERARAQFKLMKEFEKHERKMRFIIMNTHTNIVQDEFD